MSAFSDDEFHRLAQKALTVSHELTKERFRSSRLQKALDAIWQYEHAVQRDLKARGEVGDLTMHLLLQAQWLRDEVEGPAKRPDPDAFKHWNVW